MDIADIMWHHITLTCNTTESNEDTKVMRLYVDGVEVNLVEIKMKD